MAVVCYNDGMKTKFTPKNELAGGATDVFVGLVLFFIVLPIVCFVIFGGCLAVVATSNKTNTRPLVVISDESISNKYVQTKLEHELRIADEQKKYQEEQKRISQIVEAKRLKEKERLEKLY